MYMDTFGKGLSSLISGSAPTPSQSPPRAGGEKRSSPPSQTILPPHESDEGDTLRVLEVAPDRIDPNPKQPRAYFDPEKIKELEESIARHGILEPLIVTERADGRFELIAGERRLRAARNLNLPKVPILVRHADDLERLELSLIENLQRQDLNPIEEAEGYRELIEAFGLTQEEAAKKMGRSRETISNTLRLLELFGEAQKAIARGKITIGHARILLAIDNPKAREEMFQKIMDRGLTVIQAQELAAPKMRRRTGAKDTAVLADEASLRETLNTKVQIEKRGGKGRIVVHFYSDEDYQELIGKLV